VRNLQTALKTFADISTNRISWICVSWNQLVFWKWWHSFYKCICIRFVLTSLPVYISLEVNYLWNKMQ